ncbi:MAG TPA: D-2-hydroxyacid dehydrogenase family protein [Solirubrobacteraceae bacterium]|nr:D-2-hydroxyacid dehydrogenase family protein [Solirubrobacteraceae bacterium]
MPAPTVAVLDDYQDRARGLGPWDHLAGRIVLETFTGHLSDDNALAERLAAFDVIVAMRERTPFTKERLERLPKLKLLATTGMVNAAIDIDAARDLGVLVCGTSLGGSATAELTWGLILAVTRHICEEDQNIREGGWQHTIGPELAGRTLGVIGLGRLGSRVAAYGTAFEMPVVAWSQNLDAGRARGLGVEPVAKDELLERADIVSIHMRLSDRTRGLIGSRELALMKPSAYLVNTSRGAIIDEQALLDALHEGRIAGAALDVFDEEPLPREHPLRSAPNTLLTPHIGYVSEDTYRGFYREIVEDIEAWLDGAPVRVLNG